MLGRGYGLCLLFLRLKIFEELAEFWVGLDSRLCLLRLGDLLGFGLVHRFHAGLGDLGLVLRWLGRWLLWDGALALDCLLVDGVGGNFEHILDRLDRLENDKSKSTGF